ncbi:Hypothetical_protein [Hexamita inflata]|uniref:Hypothetical_protein n=1 Tax=Hexamita inflata TaxID=28002 RepID=A0AA86VTK7_9EUKA|nr:Hypothetical protein HINF_LOCUS15031 [Hexamita inflata]CAI9977473.1 Hypothetical protein HINF_LOCUS65118 [Hexamita inflata]
MSHYDQESGWTSKIDCSQIFSVYLQQLYPELIPSFYILIRFKQQFIYYQQIISAGTLASQMRYEAQLAESPFYKLVNHFIWKYICTSQNLLNICVLSRFSDIRFKNVQTINESNGYKMSDQIKEYAIPLQHSRIFVFQVWVQFLFSHRIQLENLNVVQTCWRGYGRAASVLATRNQQNNANTLYRLFLIIQHFIIFDRETEPNSPRTGSAWQTEGLWYSQKDFSQFGLNGILHFRQPAQLCFATRICRRTSEALVVALPLCWATSWLSDRIWDSRASAAECRTSTAVLCILQARPHSTTRLWTSFWKLEPEMACLKAACGFGLLWSCFGETLQLETRALLWGTEFLLTTRDSLALVFLTDLVMQCFTLAILSGVGKMSGIAPYQESGASCFYNVPL